MPQQSIQLLHVEDDPVQQRLISLNLRNVPDFQFTITRAISEEEAIHQFSSHAADIVLLDYHLSQGNGLSVLERIRAIDPLVPIIAISGQALAETASDLLRAGADDFIYKRDLTNQRLTTAIQAALQRAQQIRARFSAEQLERSRRIEEQFTSMCVALLSGPLQILANHLKQFEAIARESQLSSEQLHQLFDHAAHAHQQVQDRPGESGEELLRPLYLALRDRLFNAPTRSPS